jgi:hypothetical protein
LEDVDRAGDAGVGYRMIHRPVVVLDGFEAVPHRVRVPHVERSLRATPRVGMRRIAECVFQPIVDGISG